jgi:hypothetical protein
MYSSYINLFLKLDHIPTFSSPIRTHILLKKIIEKIPLNKGNNKITELRTILQRESQNS